MLLHGLYHGIDAFLSPVGLVVLCDFVAKFHVLFAGEHEKAGNHQTLGLRALALVLGGLETLVGIPRKAVQVQTVVPVGTTDEWQHVGTEVLNHMVERDAQVFKKTDLCTWLVVKRHHFIENCEVASLLDVGHGAEDEPAWIVVETTADVIVSTFGQGLVLVVAATIRELRRSDVNDALSGTTWYLMNETHKILIGVAETHAATYATLEERGRA